MAQIAKRIRKHIRREGGGVGFDAHVNAAVAVNSESAHVTATRTSSRQAVAGSPSGSAHSRDVDRGKETR